jgi:hypothetical protein
MTTVSFKFRPTQSAAPAKPAASAKPAAPVRAPAPAKPAAPVRAASPAPQAKQIRRQPRALTEEEVRFVVHTCAGRKDRLGPTLESLEASDIAGKYELLECCTGNYPACNDWWCETMLRLAKEPVNGVVPKFIVRLEDDVIVNQHIGHNVRAWRAYDEPDFGMGLLFNWDNQWPARKTLTKVGHVRRKDLNLCCAQGQVFLTSHLPALIRSIPVAQRSGVRGELIFDWIVTRACRLAGKYVYSHLPSLVNCHSGCRVGATGIHHQGHSSSKTFQLTWRAGRDRPVRL